MILIIFLILSFLTKKQLMI